MREYRYKTSVSLPRRLHDGQELAFDAHMDRRSLPRDALAGLTLSPADAAASASTSAADAAGAALAADGDDADAGSGGPGGDEASDEEVISIFQGLLGGYSVYQHLVVTRLMPLARAAAWTMEMQLVGACACVGGHDRMESAWGLGAAPSVLCVGHLPCRLLVLSTSCARSIFVPRARAG